MKVLANDGISRSGVELLEKNGFDVELTKVAQEQLPKFINDNKLLFAEGNAIKYICRHPHKGKKDDILKAIHYLEMIIERDYK